MGKRGTSGPVACNLCDKTIGRKADLARHMLTHLSDKDDHKQKCPFFGCEYKTFQRSNLKTHMNTHTNNKPNKCPAKGCDFRTADPSSLTRHRMQLHGYEPKQGSSDRPSVTTRKEARRRRKISPYASSSSSSLSSSGSSMSPVSLSESESPLTPVIELPGAINELLPSSISAPASDATEQLTKNDSVAYCSPLASEFQFQQANDSAVADNFQLQVSPSWASDVLAAPEPPAVEYLELPVSLQAPRADSHVVNPPSQPGYGTSDVPTAPEPPAVEYLELPASVQAPQVDSYVVNPPSQPDYGAAPNDVSNGTFDGYFSGFSCDYSSIATSCAPPPSRIQYTVDNAPIPTPYSLPPYQSWHAGGGARFPGQMSAPGYGYPSVGAPYGDSTGAMFSNAQSYQQCLWTGLGMREIIPIAQSLRQYLLAEPSMGVEPYQFADSQALYDPTFWWSNF